MSIENVLNVLMNYGLGDFLAKKLKKDISEIENVISHFSKKSNEDIVEENDWGNYEEKDTGIIFIPLPAGPNESSVGVAIGIQNVNTNERGLKSVLPLDDEMIATCQRQKWRYLNYNILNTLKRKKDENYEVLKCLLS
jgi:hypothetical protein